jgi:integrase
VKILEKYNYNLEIVANNTVNREIKKIGKMAGLSEVITKVKRSQKITQEKYKFIVSHSGRRSFLSTLYNEGINIKEIMLIANHSSLSVTMKYLQIDETEFRNRQKELDILN